MRNFPKILAGVGAVALLLGGMAFTSQAYAVGNMPSPEVCKKATDPVVKGGCVATDRKKGNCHACHAFKGIEHTRLQAGNIGPALKNLKARYTKAQVRALVYDKRKSNPRTLMPPYGAHKILSSKELDEVVDWLMTL
jgi:sulfur-oxidizing protein SoxX